MLTLQEMLGHSPDWKVTMAELRYENRQPDSAGKLLDAAESHLVELRRTPARLALQARIESLRERLRSGTLPATQRGEAPPDGLPTPQ